MKPIRKEYPPIRVYVKHGQTYYRVDLRRKHHVGPATKQFTDKAQALEYARGIAEQVAKSGLNSIAKVGTDARVAVWSEQLAIYGKTVEDAMQVALKHFAAEKSKMEIIREMKTPTARYFQPKEEYDPPKKYKWDENLLSLRSSLV